MNGTPEHRLRWYQYRLRSLFVLTVLVAVAGSWFAWKKRQVTAIRAIQKAGIGVVFQHELVARGNRIWNAQPPGPAWLRHLLGDDFFVEVYSVRLFARPITDELLGHLRCLRGLKEVNIYPDNVSSKEPRRPDTTWEREKRLHEALPNCKINVNVVD